MLALRLLILVLVMAALLVAALPVLVLLDLLRGGTGYGLCAGGLQACPARFTAGPALAAYLVVILMIVVALIRLATHLYRKLQR